MGGPVVIGIDVGTTSTKVAAYRPDGTTVADAVRSYPLETSAAGWAEQDPHRLVRRARADEPKAAVGVELERAEHRVVWRLHQGGADWRRGLRVPLGERDPERN